MADEIEKQPSPQSTDSSEGAVKMVQGSVQDSLSEEATMSPKGQEKVEKPSRIKQLWAKLDLDLPTLMIMVKGSLAPTIAIAMYQADAVANRFTTLGYLVAIMATLGFAIMPRGKFIMTMSMNILSTCLGAAVNLLALFCAVKARQHTTPPGQPLEGYNSSASAVLAIFLMVQIYLVSYLRAARPQFQFPSIVYSIFVIVSATYGTQFPTMQAVISFITKLLEAFFTGFALASAVSFFVFPTSSRKVVFKEMTGYLMCLTGMLQAQTAYMQSLEDIDPVAMREKREEEGGRGKKSKAKDKKSSVGPLSTPASAKLREMLSKTLDLHTKLNGDITPAKREFAWGKFESHDLTQLWKLMRMIFVPVTGLSASIEIIQRRAADQDWEHEAETAEEQKARHAQIDNLHFLMKQLHEPFSTMTTEIADGIQHFLLITGLVKPPKRKGDEESTGRAAAPGTPAFVEAFRNKVNSFHKSREQTLAAWCKEHGIEIPLDFFESTFVLQEHMLRDEQSRQRNQRQLFFILYLEYLLWRTSSAVLDLIVYAERRKQEGALNNSKLIFPGSKTMYKWLKAVFASEDLSNDSHFTAQMDSGGSDARLLGNSFAMQKDPEHLPPRNTAEWIGDRIRRVPNFFRNENSGFGFRVVCATMTIGIVCFLHDTQAFFLRQRLLWSLIMSAISMTRTSGQSLMGFAMRVIGTTIAVIGSFVIWYIVDGRTPGVIVFLWLWTMGAFYFVVKKPALIVVAILCMVTGLLVIGYELQVKKLGKAIAESNGQPAYPTFLLAPYRLGAVIAGLFVAFVWTFFPYPVSESTELRSDLGAVLYLMSNYYSVVHETVKSRVFSKDRKPDVKGTHAYNLDKARNALFAKLMLLLTNSRAKSQFSKFQMQIGGKFPREEYESLIAVCGRMMQYTALIGYASQTFSEGDAQNGGEGSQWSADFRRLVTSVNSTSHQITSHLSLLASSLSNGQALPPYLRMPAPLQISGQLDAIDPDLLSVRHIAEPGYSAFAVMQVCAEMINTDIEKLTKHVKNLVGEIDFSFHPVQPNESDTDRSSLESGEEKGS